MARWERRYGKLFTVWRRLDCTYVTHPVGYPKAAGSSVCADDRNMGRYAETEKCQVQANRKILSCKRFYSHIEYFI